ncbi:MAG: transposase [Lachnospiraceae bacterium]|nr:transposase [Lachnospiraceae bacterium]MDE6942626.1 transposase [Lachnospiraceae bacterium]
MMGQKDNSERNQIEFISLEDLVPENHLVRKIDAAMDFSFIYDEVRDLYKPYGRESIDPVVLIKIAFIQYIFGIRSMRKTIEEIEVNFAYRWFLGYGMHEQIPHFSTFGKNYSRRFEGTELFEHIFQRILKEACDCGFVDEEKFFIDGSHIKANANNHKYTDEVIEKSARYYEDEL